MAMAMLQLLNSGGTRSFRSSGRLSESTQLENDELAGLTVSSPLKDPSPRFPDLR
jgi:hypothetical protein